MKNAIRVMIILLLSLIITGCGKSNYTGPESGNNDDIFGNIPSLMITYTINKIAYDVSIPSGTVSWYDSETGFGIQADAPHPLDYIAERIPVIEYSSELNQIIFDFSPSPDYFIIRRWPDEYIGLVQEYADNFEIVDITDDIYNLSDSDIGYIYEIAAKWQQGNVGYVFCIR